MKTGRFARAAVVATVAMGLMACSAGSPGSDGDGEAAESVELNLVGFAVPKAANNAIQAKWAETPEGEGVRWVETYGASGDQSRAVVAGLKADYVHFSLYGDVQRLADEGLVAEDWDQDWNEGIVSSSLVVLAVRPGNPKNIQGWDDLIEPGVEIVTPNPGSSGAARWNILSAWGHAIAQGGTDEDAEEFVTDLFENIVALPGSGRDATAAFLSGTGDVLISYENETILSLQNGEDLEYFIPEVTLRIDNPGAVLIDAHPKATEWLEFVLSEAGQTEFAKTGFRPIIDGVDVGEVEGANDPSNPFPTPTVLQTINDDFFGGWDEVNPRFFDADTGIVTLIQQATGKSS